MTTDKDFERLMDIAKTQLEEVKRMTKKEAIALFHEAGILTKKGKFTKPYAILEQK